MKKPEKCGRCHGLSYGSRSHICYDASKPEPGTQVKTRTLGPRTDEHREAISESLRERWAKTREKNKPRDAAIVKRYQMGDVGITTIGREFGISRDTVLKVLRQAQAMGLVEIRRPGRTIATGAT